MNSPLLGLAFSLGALSLWSLSPFFFTGPSRRIGPFATNTLRLVLALPILLAACLVEFAWTWPAAFPSAQAWLLLAASGVVGLAIGDHFLYTAFAESGPERTSLIMTLSPAATAAIAWFVLEESMTPMQIAGMILVMAGVVGSTWKGGASARGGSPWKGAWNGVLAAICQGGGAVLARWAFLREAELSPVFATALRVGAGAFLLLLAAVFGGVMGSMLRAGREPYTARRLLAGTLAGPVGGMLFYVAALKYQPAGIVSTITFMTPLFVIPLGTWRYGTRLGTRVLLGGAVALAGVILLGWDPG